MIRKACEKDLTAILAVYAKARQFMAENGNPGQWGSHYPPEALVRDDVARGQLYVLTLENRICGVFFFAQEEDPTYQVIEDGAWLSDAPYGVIHRVASDGTVPGFLARAVQFCEQRTSHLRIDTHEKNQVMQHVIEKNGFRRCGIIRTHDGSPRIAYERL